MWIITDDSARFDCRVWQSENPPNPLINCTVNPIIENRLCQLFLPLLSFHFQLLPIEHGKWIRLKSKPFSLNIFPTSTWQPRWGQKKKKDEEKKEKQEEEEEEEEEQQQEEEEEEEGTTKKNPASFGELCCCPLSWLLKKLTGTGLFLF